VVWGNSTGGRVAQVFAGMRPDLVSAVISEDVGPERPRQIADNGRVDVLMIPVGGIYTLNGSEAKKVVSAAPPTQPVTGTVASALFDASA